MGSFDSTPQQTELHHLLEGASVDMMRRALLSLLERCKREEDGYWPILTSDPEWPALYTPELYRLLSGALTPQGDDHARIDPSDPPGQSRV